MREEDAGRRCGKGMREGMPKEPRLSIRQTCNTQMMLMKFSWHMPSDVTKCTARKVWLEQT
eukprot:15410660-Heterocapsa_arctica.AAC.1